MRVALVGPTQSGKSTLFASVAESGGSSVDLSRGDVPHLAVVKVPDDRLPWLAELYKPKKVTYAELELLDVPGLDLSDEAGRSRARAHWSAMRQSDMLVFVVREFADETVPAYRSRVDPSADVDELLTEMLFADMDQVTARIGKLEVGIKKPTGDRVAQQQELDLMNRILEALEAGQTVSSAITSEAEDKLIRSFAFLSRMPILIVTNCGEDQLAGRTDSTVQSLPAIALSAKIEEEIAQLDPDEREEFLADLGMGASAADRLVRGCYEQLNLASFLTVGEDECRAWTIPAGTEAVEAAGEIHSDISRGFIRAETVTYDDLHAAGDMKGAKAAGKVRLEGKQYVVQDGDVINFRFNV